MVSNLTYCERATCVLSLRCSRRSVTGLRARWMLLRIARIGVRSPAGARPGGDVDGSVRTVIASEFGRAFVEWLCVVPAAVLLATMVR